MAINEIQNGCGSSIEAVRTSNQKRRRGKSLAKHADRAEFHCSGKLITAARAGALWLRVHGPNRPSAAIWAEKPHHAPPGGAKSADEAFGKPLSCSTNNRVLLYTSASSHVSEQNSLLRRPVLITTFSDWSGSKLTAVDRRVSRSLSAWDSSDRYVSQSKGDQPRAARCQEGHTESQRGGSL